MKKFNLLLPTSFIIINSVAALPTARHQKATVAESAPQVYNWNMQAIETMTIQDHEKLTRKKLIFIEKIVFKN